MRLRPILPLLTLLAALAVLPAGAASASYKIGISDQRADTFLNPLYAPLHLSMARYITPWDVMSRPKDEAALIAWIANAEAAHQRILIAFQASQTPGHQRHIPSTREYTRAIQAFHRKFPEVKDVQPWNEANRCQRRVGTAILGQPICKIGRGTKAAAAYYMAARKVFRGAKISGLDVLDQANVKPTLAYIRSFLKYAHPRPTIWGFHNYSDTNRFSTKRTQALLKVTKTGQVWLTETGGIVEFGRSFPYDQKRAAKAIGCMFTIAKSNPRITRLYVYQFNGVLPHQSTFDAGLINPNNTPRPGYTVVKKRKARRCHR
jgi:hypothetical protein